MYTQAGKDSEKQTGRQKDTCRREMASLASCSETRALIKAVLKSDIFSSLEVFSSAAVVLLLPAATMVQSVADIK